MGADSATGFTCLQRFSLGSLAFIISSVLLLQFGLVTCVPEDYYNPDYDETSATGFDAYGNWNDFVSDESYTLDGNNNGGVDVMKRHLGALAAKSSRPSGVTGLRSHRSDIGIGLGGDDTNFGRFVRSWKSPFSRFAEAQSSLEFPSMMKNKRFLGSLARGGWFPRQFRGYVDSQTPGQWEKRHVGAAAKIGFLKPFKSVRGHKRDLFDGEFQGGRFEHDS